ncbi:MAG TPA: hypothetical protein VHK44_05250 [Xanthobacteraceae bacterium]|nr:hypothetical protein [Xanthobacteraceae bacterium]
MKIAGQSLFAAVFLLAACLPAAAAQTKSPGKRLAGIPVKNPMVFYLAQGEPNSCGPGCDQWIAAEGALAHGTAERMRAFLLRQGSKAGTLPIYFNSPGGITTESIAMGRLMRERGMTARVARTIPKVCEGEPKQCASAKRSGRPLAARLTSTSAQCNSACVYAIVGARLREIAPEAHLGIHAAKTVVVGYLPRGMHIPAELHARFKARNQQLIRRYLVDMGIQPALLDAADKIPHESIRALGREEMVRFNIDTRSVVESSWIYDERINDRGTIFKSIDMTDPGGAEYRKTMLRVSCLGGDQLMVGYAREVGPKENSFVPLKFVAAKQEFKLAPPAEPVSGTTVSKRYDIRRAPVPMRAFESAAAEDRIELAPDQGEGRPGVTKLSTIGLASALSSLTRRCSQGSAASGGAGLVPRQVP